MKNKLKVPAAAVPLLKEKRSLNSVPSEAVERNGFDTKRGRLVSAEFRWKWLGTADEPFPADDALRAMGSLRSILEDARWLEDRSEVSLAWRGSRPLGEWFTFQDRAEAELPKSVFGTPAEFSFGLRNPEVGGDSTSRDVLCACASATGRFRVRSFRDVREMLTPLGDRLSAWDERLSGDHLELRLTDPASGEAFGALPAGRTSDPLWALLGKLVPAELLRNVALEGGSKRFDYAYYGLGGPNPWLYK